MIPAEKAVKLTEEIERIEAQIDTLSNIDDAELKSLEDLKNTLYGALPKEVGGTLDAPWTEIEPAERERLYARLIRLRNFELSIVSHDGPADPKSIMARRHATNPWILILAFFGVAGSLIVLTAIVHLWPHAVLDNDASTQPPTEQAVIQMIVLFGTLGGFIHYIGSLAKYVGNRRLVRSWILYYFLTPLQGAALAPLVYLLLRVGVLSTGTTNGLSSTEHLNLLGLYAFAGLTGLFAKLATEKLGELFASIFKTDRSSERDRLKK